MGRSLAVGAAAGDGAGSSAAAGQPIVASMWTYVLRHLDELRAIYAAARLRR